MIYTVTFNPALDYVVDMDSFVVGDINRTIKETVYPGGKGINVSLVLRNLGFDSIALGFEGGATGGMLVQMLNDLKCQTDFIHVQDGQTRINVKIRANKGSFPETAINGQGPRISDQELKAFYKRLDMLRDGDILVLAGSIPSSLSQEMYRDILSYLSDRNVEFVVDATGQLMMNVLEYRPFLVKPNDQELAETFGVKIETKDDIWYYAGQMQKLGAKNILISLGGSGAMFLGENGMRLEMKAPEGKLVNSVGAGDSMVAGFLAGWIKHKDYREAMRLGVCCGSASAFKDWLADRHDIDNLLDKIK